jgi:glycosyltransferase involved in cell wall biosynthesis
VRISLLGTRGVPAAYSGFETAVENIGARLAARGHVVTVYCRPHMVEGRHRTYRGMRLVYLPTVRSKHLDTFAHTFLSTLHMAFVARPQVAVYFIAGNSPFAGLSRLLGVPSALNVDGLDSRRAKWGGAAKRYLRWAERAAPRMANAVITDSRSVQQLYRNEFGAETHYIPYGAEPEDPAGLGVAEAAASATAGATSTDTSPGADTPADAAGSVLQELGLRPRGYLLFVGRLVPENNAHVLADAFAQLQTDLKLVIVGDAPYAEDYKARLAAAAREGVILPGYVFGARYRELARNAAVFVVPTEVGGTHPVLLEAMATGNAVVVNDHAPNLEVIGDAGESYRGRDGAQGLAAVLTALLADPDRIAELRRRARERAARLYSWDAVTDAYEALARSLAR